MAATDALVSHAPGVADTEPGVSGPDPGPSFTCDACGETFGGVPGGSGLFIWTRGEEIRYEEPPLCEDCAVAVSTTAMLGWALDEEDEE